MPAGIAATHRDENIVGTHATMHEAGRDKAMGASRVLLIVFAVTVLSDAPHAIDRSLGLSEQEILGSFSAPARVSDDLHVLGSEDDNALPKCDASIIGHRICNCAEYLLRRIAAMILDIAEAATCIDSDA
jgi:hypothetical protein